MKHFSLIHALSCGFAAASLLLSACSSGGTDASQLLTGFVNPPQEALPRVWWHWMNGNISKDGIRKDLFWMNSVGIGGAHCFDAGLSTPQIVDHRITYMTPEWKDAFAYAVHLTDSMNMELTIPSSPGWSATGGPWVEPKDAMKKLTWREMVVQGGQTFAGNLPEPYEDTGSFLNFPFETTSMGMGEEPKVPPTYYEDIAVVAVRLPEADRSMQEMQARVTANGGTFTVDQLTDGDIRVAAQLPADRVKGYCWIQYEFPQAETIKALTLVDGSKRSEFDIVPEPSKHSLWASNDGKNYTKVADIPVGSALRQTFDITPTTARFFQVRFANPQLDSTYAYYAALLGVSFPLPTSSPIYELVLHPVTRINHAEEKAAFAATYDLALYPTPEAEANELVATADVVDLTAQVDAEGHLTWDVPEGRWRIYRFGWSLIGKENHPASPEATGLEVDKMDPDAYTRYFRHYFDMYKDASGGLIGQRGVQYVLTDSYEAGSATWTPRLPEEFKARRGYDLTPWLPVLTGQIVGSTEESERFLFDWRKTLGDLIAENYDLLGRIAKEEYGLKGRYSEAHENGRLYMVDGMEVKRDADVAMAAIWVPGRASSGSTLSMAQADIRESASAAHVYGGKLVAAESMTCVGMAQQAWSYCPENLKPIVDTEFYSGVNRIVVHTSVHQPSDDHIPGLGLMIFGQWFNRHETWAQQAKAWTSYLARNSYMMQQGQYVADVAYYYGEDNNVTSLFGAKLPDMPYGYSFDFINSDALTRLLAVKKGRLTTPSGMTYRLLALDDNAKTMSLPVLRRLAELADQGAVICGAVPEKIGGLGDQEEFNRLVDQVWHAGRKNVLGGQTVAQALQAQGIAPDFSHNAAASDSIRFVHRTIQGGPEFYWVNNVKDQPASFTASFRTSGARPQLWHPETGQVEELSYALVDGRTEVQLDLVNRDAVYIVFSGKADATGQTLPKKEQTQLLTVEGPWQVTFQEHRGAPASTTLDELVSLTESSDPGIKYFSGTATYTHTLTLAADDLQADGRLLLDLGSVGNIAEVSVNGKEVATLWKTPFVADITDALQPGDNTLTISVTNLWPNRLIGDAQPGVEQKLTYTSMPFYTAADPLLPSGLMGPVTLALEK